MVELKLTAGVGEKGQIVIPKPVRDMFGITPHTEVVFSIQDDKIVLEKKNPKQVCLEFITAVKDRIKMPKKVDWDELFSPQ